MPPVDIDAIRAEAYALGKKEAKQGNLESEQALRAKLRQTLAAFTLACAEVDTLHQDLLEQSRGDMINLVIALSKKIIGHELSTGRDVIVSTLRNAIALAMKHNEYDIWLNPEDLTVVEELVPELISSVQQLKHITLKTDPEITRGGCRLDSDICTVDATIEAQLETARDFLEEKSPNYNNSAQQNGDTPIEEQSDEP
jgi:flagellar assembly protein FliH